MTTPEVIEEGGHHMSDNRDVVFQGGLMRCCLGSLGEFLETDKTSTSHRCRYCKNPMVLTPKGWMWDSEQSRRDEEAK